MIFPSCDGALTEAERNVNEYIYPYLTFELSDTLTYYTATVVAGANLATVSIPGEYHTDFGAMPIREFSGYENPEDAESLVELILDQNVKNVAEDALEYAVNIEYAKHDGLLGASTWAYLPPLAKKGYHFVGWKADDEYIWKFVDGEYKQLVFEIDSEHAEAAPVFYPLVKIERVDPTCTEDGNIEYFRCEDCGKIYSDKDGVYEIDDVLIPSSGHYLVFRESISPTCETEGQIEHYDCEICGMNFTDSEGANPIDDVTIDMVDHVSDETYHKNEDGHWFECIVCHTELKKEAHDWDEGVINKHPTDNEDGLKIYTCEICSATKEEILSDHVHKLGDEVAEVPATCTEDSYKRGTCTECGREVTIKTGNKLGHLLSAFEHEGPDCLNAGTKKHFACSRCNLNFTNSSAKEVLEDVSIPALGHSYKSVWSHDAEYHWKVCNRDENHKTEPIKHSLDKEIESAVFQKIPANCEHGAIYYKSCECGEMSKTETFESGSVMHRFENENGEKNYVFDKNNHWIECRVCGIDKEGSKGSHELVTIGSIRACSVCSYRFSSASGGFNPELEEIDPRGQLVLVSHDGNVYTFKVVNKNDEFPITSYKWETSGIAISDVNGSTFSFEAPKKRTYSVRCVFSNGYGVGSLSTTVNGGNGI